MMQDYLDHIIQELPLSAPYFRCQVERFLEANGLRMEALDAFFTVQGADGQILAGAGLQGDILKCVAVAAAYRSEGLLAPLVSHVISVAASRGILNLKVFTKPEHQAVFESLGFRLLAAAPEAILLENGRGLERYCAYLRTLRRPGRSGVIVMNANPFTLGHQYLIQKAGEQADHVYVIPVKEDVSLFPYAERLSMIKEAFPVFPEESTFLSDDGNTGGASSNAARVIVAEGSAYCISAATFPTYFLKDLSAAAETQMRLDIDLFARWIAPALGNPVRFVGSEPGDPLTARYNALLQEGLPQVVVIPRLELSAGPTAEENYFSGRCPKNQFSPAIAKPSRIEGVVSASAVRAALDAGSFAAAADLCPATTWPYLLAALADRALRRELDLPGKPGLVGPDGPGAHKDMDYDKMLRGIDAIRPFWPRMALAASIEELRRLGIDAEEAMLAATGGVNTHRGAIFAMGLAVAAAARRMELIENEENIQNALLVLGQGILRNSLTDSDIHSTLVGARRMAFSGYRQLFDDWLPYYTKNGELKTLLHIMSTLDDTCVVKRVGAERAREVKQEAATVLTSEEKYFSQGFAKNHFSSAERSMQEFCERYAAEGISPGGAADMLALTIFIDSIL
ncbi:MAG: triphosphoribosyl-dephospho-CoA synthase [Bacteroidales bacterium]|nr:triphosphoribosyl-dephospho-CoA synthase [Bacteroidales bacterium]